jgi:hypothetical protein
MAKSARRVLAATGLVVVGLAGITPPAFAKPESSAKSMTLMVLVENRASVPANILEKAREDATWVFQDMDIAIVWLEDGDARLENPAVLKSVSIVRLLPRELAEHMKAPDGRLGMAASGARVVSVFYNRIQGLASIRNDADTASILGHVIAHEIGHLLLPPSAHSRAGIMQAELNTQVAARRGLYFTATQARQIRNRLGADLWRQQPQPMGTLAGGKACGNLCE